MKSWGVSIANVVEFEKFHEILNGTYSFVKSYQTAEILMGYPLQVM